MIPLTVIAMTLHTVLPTTALNKWGVVTSPCGGESCESHHYLQILDIEVDEKDSSSAQWTR